MCQQESSRRTIPPMLRTIRTRRMPYLIKCGLKHISAVLYCASQNQDNRKCCNHLNLADSKLGVGDRCLRFCDPAGQGINAISRNDATCLFNLNVIFYCHQSGIPLD
uniref:DB domain-containing protein n=1 Tax=Loa loa TaxID=7209 RepID=A0A1I7VPE5_LOALO